MSGYSAPSGAGTPAQAYLMLLVTAFCWGLNAVLGQLVVDEASPMVVVTLRWTGVVLLMTLFWSGQVAEEWPVLRKRLVYLFFMGVTGFTAFNTLFYFAAYTTTALNVGIIQGAMPVFVFIGAYAAYRERITVFQVVGTLITLTGVVFVAAAGDLDRLLGLDFVFGDVLMVLAGVCYAAYAVGLRAKPDVSPMSMFAVLSASALIASLPMLAVEGMIGTFQAPTPKGWLWVLVITLLPSFLAQILFIRSVAIVGPGRAGIFFNLVPVIAPGLAVLILGEHFASYHAIALVLVLVGIGIAESRKPSSP